MGDPMMRPVRKCTILVRASILVACSIGVALAMPAISGPPPAAEVSFEQFEVVTGSAKDQTVLTGHLLGRAVADLVVVSSDDDDGPRLRIYSLSHGAWVPQLDQALRHEVLFVDVANIGGHDRLLVYEPGGLSCLEPESGTERPLVVVTSDLDLPPRRGVPHVDVTRDVNDDGRDDLVMPEVDGFSVYIQIADGTFADPVKLGPSTGTGRMYGSGGYRHSPWTLSGIHEVDFNRDGRQDLVFWSNGHFEVHSQDEHGLLAPEARTFTTDVTLDGGWNPCSRRPENGFDPVEACFESDHSSLTTGDMKESSLHSLTDVNGDGVADLVVFSLEGKSVFSIRSAYEVHFGAPTAEGGIVFTPEVGTTIGAKGMPGWMERHDLDLDGQADMSLTTLRIGFFKIIGALVTRSTSLDLELYRMEDGSYPDRANVARTVKIDIGTGEAGEKQAAYAPVLIGDVNGDGHSDLVLGKGRKELQVFVGVPGPDLFVRKPQKVAVAIPNDERFIWLMDLDDDGKQDILVHQPSTTEPHRVTMLVAR